MKTTVPWHLGGLHVKMCVRQRLFPKIQDKFGKRSQTGKQDKSVERSQKGKVLNVLKRQNVEHSQKAKAKC